MKKRVAPYSVSRKCSYALRAIFELALRNSPDPVKVQDIASAQAIPPRFLEIILSELKHAGFVRSRRGNDGGFVLARHPAYLSVAEVITFFQTNAYNPGQNDRGRFSRRGDYVFSKLWSRVNNAIAEVYNSTTFSSLVEEELARNKTYVPDYAI